MKVLTIGLPVYNAMPYLKESVASLLNQTDSNFDILAIDDGSTDGSLAYLRNVSDPRLRVISQENRGLTATLNRMMREVNTPWLARHDADDIALPDRVAIMRRAIERYPDAGMFYSEARYYQDGRSLASFRTSKAGPEKLRELTSDGYLLAICHPTVVLNVAKTQSVGGYRFDLHVEDIDLWWRMALRHEVRFIPEVTTYFRHNAASVSTGNLERQSVNTLYVQYLLLSHLRQCHASPYLQVEGILSMLLDRRKLKFREEMRKANISMARKEYGVAVGRLMSAALASPPHFVDRVRYEMSKNKIAVSGEDPALFLGMRDLLWPEEACAAGEREMNSDVFLTQQAS